MNEPAAARPFRDPSPGTVAEFLRSIPLFASDDDPTFWDLSRIDGARNRLLTRQLGWLSSASPYYMKKFADAGVDPDDIHTTDDLRRLPVTTKADLMEEPHAFRLRFESPTLYDMTYVTVYTSGTTTGSPTPYEYAGHDLYGAIQAARRNAKIGYWVPGFHYFNAFPLSPLPHIASAFGPIQCSAAGVHFLHGLGGAPYDEFPPVPSGPSLLTRIEREQPQILAGIGSFLRRLIADAARSGADLASLKTLVVSGETFTAKMLERLHTNLATCGADDVFVMSAYGGTETGVSWTWCHEGGPLHLSAPDQLFVEILDPDTLEPVADEAPGLVVLTHLNRRGMPLLRYVMGDVSAQSTQPCPKCGRTTPSLLVSSGSAHVTRTGDLVKVKGTLINPQVLHHVLMSVDDVAEYQVVLDVEDPDDPDSAERFVVRLGLDATASRDGWSAGEARSEEVRRRVGAAIEVRPLVEVVDDLSEIYDPNVDFKARRIIDRRPSE